MQGTDTTRTNHMAPITINSLAEQRQRSAVSVTCMDAAVNVAASAAERCASQSAVFAASEARSESKSASASCVRCLA